MVSFLILSSTLLPFAQYALLSVQGAPPVEQLASLCLHSMNIFIAAIVLSIYATFGTVVRDVVPAPFWTTCLRFAPAAALLYVLSQLVVLFAIVLTMLATAVSPAGILAQTRGLLTPNDVMNGMWRLSRAPVLIATSLLLALVTAPLCLFRCQISAAIRVLAVLSALPRQWSLYGWLGLLLVTSLSDHGVAFWFGGPLESHETFPGKLAIGIVKLLGTIPDTIAMVGLMRLFWLAVQNSEHEPPPLLERRFRWE